MRRLAFLVFILSVCLLCRPPLRTANGDDSLPIDPADPKMTSEPKAPGAPASYLYRQVDRITARRASNERDYVRTKILNEEGRKYANVEIPYRKEDAGVSISNIRARAIHPSGPIENFNGQIFEQTIEKTKGVKTLAKTFTLPNVQVGSIVEYHWNFQGRAAYLRL
jgi:hypothetical protein